MAYMTMQITSSEEQFAEMVLAEQLELILEQISDPINKLSVNYFKTFLKSVEEEYVDDPRKAKAFKFDASLQIIDAINNVYDNKIHIHELTDEQSVNIADVLYRFFVRNSYSNIENFLTQYLLNSSNRKNITEYLKDTKTTAYTREAYGTKQNYIIANNVPKIIDLIIGSEISFDEVIKFMTKNMDCPGHVNRLDSLIKDGIIEIDDSIIQMMIQKTIDSHFEGSLINSLITMIHVKIIGPVIGAVSMFHTTSQDGEIPLNNENLFILKKRENA